MEHFDEYADVQDSRIILGAASTNNALADEVYIFDNFGGSRGLTEILTPSDLSLDISIGSVAIGAILSWQGC